MRVKSITYHELKYAIEHAFWGDRNIYDIYDRAVEVNGLSDIVTDILKKVTHNYAGSDYYEVRKKGSQVGYFVVYESEGVPVKLLVSFGVAMKYRTPKELPDFFMAMAAKIGAPFMCVLWNQNKRAIGWLVKCGLSIIEHTDDATTLLYEK